MKPGDFDWKAIFAQGVRWVHCGGIFASLSPTTAALAAEMMKEAKAAGAVTSFDLNFRAKLWNIQGGNEKAVETIGKIVENVDVLVGNEEDLQMGLGIPGPEVAAKSKLDPSVFFGMMEKVTRKLPNAKVVATTLREVHSTNRHSWSAVAWVEREDLPGTDGGAGRGGSRGRRRWLCRGLHLWAAHRRGRRKKRSSWAGRMAHC